MTRTDTVKVLLIEDNPDHAQLAQSMLSEPDSSGFDVSHVIRLKDALEYLQKQNPDVILLDISLPDNSGLGSVTRIKEAYPRLPIVVLSADDDEGHAFQAVQMGAQDYLVKGQGDSNLIQRSIRYAIERKRAELASLASEKRYRDLLDNATDLVQSVGSDGRFLYVNWQWLEVMGYRSDEVPHLHFEDIIRSDEVEHCRSVFNQLARGAKVSNMETVFVTKGGRELYVEGNLSAQLADGTFMATLGIFRDLTERRQVEEAEREHRTLAEALRDTAAALNSTLDIDELLDHILTNVGQVVPHEAASFMLVEGDVARVVRQRGYKERGTAEWMTARTFPLSELPGMRNVLTAEQTQIISETRDNHDWLDYPETRWIRSYISAPIQLAEHQIIGFLNLSSSSPNFFTPAHAERLLAFADQAAIAIENARLHEDIHKRATRLELVAGIGKQTTAILELDDLLNQAVNLINDTFGYYLTNIVLIKDGFMVLEATSLPTMRAKEGKLRAVVEKYGIVGWVAYTSEPLMVPDVSSDSRYVFVEEASETNSELAVPIKLKDTIIGVLDVQSKQLNAFSKADIFLLQTVADQLAVAIENAELYDHATSRAAELEELRQVGLGLTASLERQAVLDAILKGVLKLTNDTDNAYIYLLQDGSLELGTALHSGEQDVVIDLDEPRPDGLHYSVARQGDVIVVPDIRAHPLFKDAPSDWQGAIIGLPIKYGQQLLGVLSIYCPQPHVFTDSELRLLRLFSDQAGVAIQNAQLYDTIRRRRRYLETLRRLSHRSVPERDRQTLMQTVVDGLVDEFGYPVAAISLGNDDTRTFKVEAIAGQYADQLGFEKGEVFRYGEGILGWVMDNGEAYLARDIERDPHYIPPPSKVDLGSELATPIHQNGKVIGVVTASATEKNAFDELDMEAMVELADELGLKLENLELNEQAETLAALEERQRLAHDLHDSVTQALSSANLIAEVLPRLWEEKPDKLMPSLIALRQLTQGALAEMRSLLLELRPATLLDAKLGHLLGLLTDALIGRTPVNLTLKIEDERPISSDITIALYRIAQEALNNIVKHARASKVEVSLSSKGQQLHLRISDNGRGFDPQAIPVGHMGVGIMRERAAAINATLNVESRVGSGTDIVVVWTEQ